MTTVTPEPLPTERPRGCPFDPPSELRDRARRGPFRDGRPPVQLPPRDHAAAGGPGRLHRPAAARAPGLDLVPVFAQAVPALVICELLGVPADERERFQRLAEAANDLDADQEALEAAMGGLGGYIADLVEEKRRSPTDDLLSDLTASDLTSEELVAVGSLLLGAGLDTTANMIGLGVFALLTHPDQVPVMREGPEAVEGALEELLRYLTIAHTTVRVALEDVELDGRVIRAGETVTIAAQAADRDPEKFADPDTLDLRRNTAGHLAFGHGPHQCLGQQLARVELRVALAGLFGRFPTLRLAAPADEVRVREHADVHGVHGLPVTWDGE